MASLSSCSASSGKESDCESDESASSASESTAMTSDSDLEQLYESFEFEDEVPHTVMFCLHNKTLQYVLGNKLVNGGLRTILLRHFSPIVCQPL